MARVSRLVQANAFDGIKLLDLDWSTTAMVRPQILKITG